MPAKSFETDVKPKVLQWARETIGFSPMEAAKKLKIVEGTLIKWEAGEKKPTLAQLRKLASVYKRPLAAFFLPEPPKEPLLPKDYRTLPQNEKKPFSPKTRLAVRRARRLQSLASELAGNLNRKLRAEIDQAILSDAPEIIAVRIREKLGITIQTQLGWKNEIRAIGEWKQALEKLGILVFHISAPLKETRGFSLTDQEPRTIVLNLQDTVNGRIFSLFHEYGHLLLNESGICDMGDQERLPESDKAVEKFCNHFAGAILVPKFALSSHKLVAPIRYRPEWPEEILSDLARSFKVSQEVILRRLLILGYADPDFYRKMREKWLKTAFARKGRGGRNPPKECVQKNGAPFVSLVIESQRKEKITYSDVADYLNVRLKYLPKIEQLIEGRV